MCTNKTKSINPRGRGNNEEIFHPAIKLQERKLCQKVGIENNKNKRKTCKVK